MRFLCVSSMDAVKAERDSFFFLFLLFFFCRRKVFLSSCAARKRGKEERREICWVTGEYNVGRACGRGASVNGSVESISGFR